MPPKKDVRVALDSLRSLSPRLNSVTDLANETVREVERFLNEECSIGLVAVVPVDDDTTGSEPTTYLEYRRVGPRFRIAVVLFHEGEDLSVKPWSDCSRAQKLETFAKLPDLLAVLAKRVEEQLEATEKTAKEVASSIAAKPIVAKPIVANSLAGGGPAIPAKFPPLPDKNEDIPF